MAANHLADEILLGVTASFAANLPSASVANCMTLLLGAISRVARSSPAPREFSAVMVAFGAHVAAGADTAESPTAVAINDAVEKLLLAEVRWEIGREVAH